MRGKDHTLFSLIFISDYPYWTVPIDLLTVIYSDI